MRKLVDRYTFDFAAERALLTSGGWGRPVVVTRTVNGWVETDRLALVAGEDTNR